MGIDGSLIQADITSGAESFQGTSKYFYKNFMKPATFFFLQRLSDPLSSSTSCLAHQLEGEARLAARVAVHVEVVCQHGQAVLGGGAEEA